MTGSIVSPALRARVRGIAERVAVLFGRLGLTPNQLTLIGFGIAVAAAVAAGREAWLAAGLLVLIGGIFDLFDGALARATGRANRLGAFMDSVFDRAGEGVVYVGIAWGSVVAGVGAGAILSTAALAGAFMVSYIRAKSESLGFTPGTGMANVGLAPREVRIVILSLALIGAGLAGPGDGTPGASWLLGGLTLIAVLATYTMIQRILHVLAQAKEG